MTGRRRVAAVMIGAVVAVAYSFSPLSLWFIATVWLFAAAATKGIAGRERVWLVRLIVAAVATRLLALSVFFVATHHGASAWFAPMLPDETYMVQRAAWLRNIALGVPMPTVYYVESGNAYGQTTFHQALALVELWAGPASYGLRLVSAGAYLLAVLVLYRLARVGFGRLAALVSLAFMLFLPTLFVWSITLVKEAPFACLSSIAIAAGVTAARPGATPLRRRAACVALAVLALFLLRGVREGGDAIIGAGLVGGIAVSALLRRPVLFATTCVLMVLALLAAVRQSSVTSRVEQQFQAMAAIHVGNVMTQGYAYKLLDPEFYPGPGRSLADATARMDPSALVRFVIRAVASVILVPLPWQAQSRPARALLAEQVVWYLLVACAMAGVVVGVRRDPTLTIVLFAVVCSSALVVGVTNGNIGTLVRIREMIVVPMLWLSGPGISAIMNGLAAQLLQPGVPAAQPASA